MVEAEYLLHRVSSITKLHLFENHVSCKGNGCLKRETERVNENSELQQISAESSTGKEKRTAPMNHNPLVPLPKGGWLWVDWRAVVRREVAVWHPV
jgi:hypothetical protein